MEPNPVCPNCFTEKVGPYCTQCGQDARDYRRAFPSIFANVLEESFHFDGRFANTLKLLLLKPGELSREFSLNRRARYVPAVRLYLFTSLLFFFVFALNAGSRAESARVIDIDLPDATAQTDTHALNRYLDSEYQAKVALIEARKGSFGRVMLLQWAVLLESDSELNDSDVTRLLLPLVVDALVSPKRTFDVLIDNIAIAIFVFLPLYALVLKLFYLGVNRRYYIEHFVFAMHLHSVGFIVFTALACIAFVSRQGNSPTADLAWLQTGLVIAYFGYHYLSLLRYYGQSWFKTSIKFTVLTAVYGVLLGATMFSTAAFTLTTL
ncbi:MAG TPA: DUF3667 domain-containing protein [Pseudomonadales bacterium]|nr:DUF3667 domain-containing protein [Pseudomonadales bacterium]